MPLSRFAFPPCSGKWRDKNRSEELSLPPFPVKNFYALLVQVVNVGEISMEGFGLLDFSILPPEQLRMLNCVGKKASRQRDALRHFSRKKRITRIITSVPIASQDLNTSLWSRNKESWRRCLYATYL